MPRSPQACRSLISNVLYLGLHLSRILPSIQLALEIAMFVLLLALIERHRCTGDVAATFGISLPDAAKIMSTPTRRTAVWQLGPVTSLIRGS